jgi:hypothetical protein
VLLLELVAHSKGAQIFSQEQESRFGLRNQVGCALVYMCDE